MSSNHKSIIAIPNCEKQLHESWDDERDMLNFPRPFRWCVFGEPNRGKSCLILNYLLEAGEYDRIFILHPRSFNPNVEKEYMAANKNLVVADCLIPEYKEIEYIPLQYIPNEKFFEDLDGHSLFIIDDIDLIGYSRANKERARVINKLFSYVSTHSNVSIITTSQSPSLQLPPIVCQMANIVTLFKMRDKYKIRTLAQKLGKNQDMLMRFLDLCTDKHDTVTFDESDDSPYPYRKNIYQTIILKDKDNSVM